MQTDKQMSSLVFSLFCFMFNIAQLFPILTIYASCLFFIGSVSYSFNSLCVIVWYSSLAWQRSSPPLTLSLLFSILFFIQVYNILLGYCTYECTLWCTVKGNALNMQLRFCWHFNCKDEWLYVCQRKKFACAPQSRVTFHRRPDVKVFETHWMHLQDDSVWTYNNLL